MTKCWVGFAIDIVLMMMTVFDQEHPTYDYIAGLSGALANIP